MNEPEQPASLIEKLVSQAVSGASSADRFLLGVVGTPGSGKSTFAKYLRWRLGFAPIVEMDGFHLSNAELERAGMLHRKGAIETFDGHGFVELMQKTRHQSGGDAITAPRFDRLREECVPDAIRIASSDRIVIVEGNYLLSNAPPWSSIRPILDLCTYLDIDAAARVERLIRRHMSYGRSRAEARRFVLDSDERNAALIEETRHKADLFIDVSQHDVSTLA